MHEGGYTHAALYRNRLFVAAICDTARCVSTTAPCKKKEQLTAMVFSRGCQLACKIFLLKSSVSSAMFSRIPPPGRPFLTPALLPGRGPPIFFALNADLSA